MKRGIGNDVKSTIGYKKGRSIRIRIETGMFVRINTFETENKKGRSIRIRIETGVVLNENRNRQK